jgi:hypothetical protein
MMSSSQLATFCFCRLLSFFLVKAGCVVNPRDLAHLNIFALMFHGAGVWLECAL